MLAANPKPTAPSAVSARVHSLHNAPVEVTLGLWDSDAPETYSIEIISSPANGRLAGSGIKRSYTPNAGFTKQDTFTWRATGPGWTTNTASVTVYANASGENSRPQVDDLSVSVSAGGERLINLRYSDPDGPGPHLWTIRVPPEHGTLSGADNDVLYTPAPGLSGTDRFSWAVSDGLSRSRNATVTITVR
ncbi:MAG: Ig-like domain-containing protein [Acidobacteria bacterium]|nr:Ig-like domain-containing protein [Acidobacteriota bacterium]